MSRLYESDFEETTIERLKRIDYNFLPAHELFNRQSLSEVVLNDRLEGFLRQAYPAIPSNQIPVLASRFTDPDGITYQLRNENFHSMLVKGIDFSYEQDGEVVYHHVFPISWDTLESNDFLVVNQLAIEGRMARRPDIIIYINGLPLVVFELKSPYKEDATVEDAYTQITNYTYDISQLFNYIAFSVISDGSETLHGMPGAPMEFFSAWKSIDGRTVDNNIANTMRTLIEGLFPKDRILQYIQNFITFMKDGDKSIKIGAKYHQFFGIQFAVEEAIRATRPDGDRKIGVIWHTQGSGKSISMLFFAGLLIRDVRMDNPTIVIQVDRGDLDTQLYDTFVAGQSLVGYVHQANSANDLRDLLRNESGQIIFSTIEKFRLKESEGLHPVLSERRNIVVIADEAHRTQYNDTGFRGNLIRALPNASHIGFTGTPISFTDRDTEELFGHVIHTYDMKQAVQDKATVPIYFESRLIPLDLNNANLDEDFKAIIDQAGAGDGGTENYRLKWSVLEKVVSTPNRLKRLAEDILEHFSKVANSWSKGMIVGMSRETCVALYDHLRRQPNCPPVEVVITGDVDKDPKEWREKQPGSKYPHIKTKQEQEAVKEKLKDPEDPLKLVIVCDMWLTGTDIPTLQFLYVDKPMKGHNLMQAIARVNRVYPGKEGGIVVDYIGISTSLKEATRKYTQGGGKGNPTEDISEAAYKIFMANLEQIRPLLPEGTDVIHWRGLGKIEREDFLADLVSALLGDKQDPFLTIQLKLSKAHQLVRHLPNVIPYANEVLLYDILAVQLKKLGGGGGQGGKKKKKEIDKRVNDLVDESITANETIDIFAVAGIEKPDISILDEAFLADLTKKKHVDLRLKLLEKLLHDQIQLKLKQKNPKYNSIKQALEKTIADYHNRVIAAADVIRWMIQVKQEINDDTRVSEELGLSDDEMAFYHIIEGLGEASFSNDFIADLIHKVVAAMKKEFQVDWTNPHRQDILAKVNLAVKMVLMKEKIKGEQLRFLTNAIVEQAKEQYKDYPILEA